MKRLLSITALALVIALSLAFTGCSGAQKDASANFQGSWKMTNVAGIGVRLNQPHPSRR